MTTHALLSPSGAPRWMNCPGSVALEATLPGPGASSAHADEGTAAHALGANCLQRKIDTGNPTALDGIEERYLPYVGEDMLIDVQAYVDMVRGLMAQLVDPVLLVEQRVAYTDYVPDGEGTADAILIGTDPLTGEMVGHVIDLKYGTGVRVFASGNEQLRLYALGADQTHGFIYGVARWHLTIAQIRLGHIDTEVLTREELHEWAKQAREAAHEALSPNASFHPSEKACRWCRAKAICKARAEAALAIARTEFEVVSLPPDPKALTLDQIAEILPRLSILTDWASAVEQHALQLALEGQHVPGHKLVEGRSNRQWADKAAAVQVLQQHGLAESLLYKPREIVGIPEVEKLLKVIGKSMPEQLIVKPPGKPALVPDSDPRPAVVKTTAQDDFKAIDPWEIPE